MLQKVSEEIARHRVFLITAHERLDGDALGSELALWHMLRGMGKDVTIYNQDPTPESYLFLPGSDRIVHEMPPLEPIECAIILDCSEIARVGMMSARIGKIPSLINIDHHISNGVFCPITLIDSQASSTGELICRLASQMGFSLNREVATCLYTAILTDTGGFRYSNTRPASLLAAANLVAAGAEPQWISENVYDTNPPAKIRLLGAVLPTLSLDSSGRVGSLTVTQQAMAAAGALPEHAEGFVELPRSIRGVRISILYTEIADGRFKVSLRSKGKADVERVARAFGGGGHSNAAGCRMDGELADIRRRVLEEIESVHGTR